ncbi:hypothetical protein DFH09DRAFT_1326350 [Mycena vulgaris]|nr:hypothetical protein DFH09DRAFT_1326350 [Mycena vulgaris]
MPAERSLSSRGPARQAAKKASIKFEAQLMPSPLKPDENEKSPTKPKRARSRPNLKAAKLTSSSSRSATVPRPRAQPRAGSRKRPISLDSRKSDDEESDLTSLSARTASPTPMAKAVTTKPWLELPDTDSKYMWVLLDFDGQVFGLEDEDDAVERIWWPSVVVSSENSTFRVQLFGTIGSSNSDNIVEVATPHDGNLLPLAPSRDAEIRFINPCYVTSQGKHTESPKKRQKLDRSGIETQWRDALSRFIYDIQENEFPSLVFLNSRKASGKGKAKVKATPRAEDEFPDPRWSPPPPDESLLIPGELILAREKRARKEHWPARILAYIPPANAATQPYYHVQWIDNTENSIERDMFFTYEDEEFGTCFLGKYDSVFKDVANDDANAPDARNTPDSRLSPDPLDPPPTGHAFADLGVQQQFVHAKPVLQAILRDEYPPARDAHKLFIGGGRGRNEVVKEAGQRGLMDPRDVDKFQECLLEWVMRKTDKGARVEDTKEPGVAVEEEIAANVPDIPAADTKAELPVPIDEQISDEDPALQETLCAPASPTATVLDEGASSPAPPPPSSSFSPDSGVAMDETEEPDVERQPDPALADDDDDDDKGKAFDTESTLSEASDVSDLVQREKPPRQIGCPAYEGLSTVEKMDYCLNVLLPELLTQILLWRTGARTQVALLASEDEERLHKLGEEEKTRSDWVFDVQRLRMQKEREIKKEEVVVGGTASRPRKALRR